MNVVLESYRLGRGFFTIRRHVRVLRILFYAPRHSLITPVPVYHFL